MDPLFLAVIRFRQRQFDDCIAICGEIIRKNPLDQAVWSLKTQALTEQVRVDFLEIFDEGIADSLHGGYDCHCGETRDVPQDTVYFTRTAIPPVKDR
jgi:hypothetical protein